MRSIAFDAEQLLALAHGLGAAGGLGIKVEIFEGARQPLRVTLLTGNETGAVGLLMLLAEPVKKS